MEVGSYSSVETRMWVCSLMEFVLAETFFSASKSIACLLLLTVSLLNEINGLPKLTAIDESFSIHELHQKKCPDLDVKDASETEDYEDDYDDDNDNDAGDKNFSGEGEEGDLEDDPEANGDGGSDDDEDDDDDDGDENDPDEDGEDDEDNEDEDDVSQPPTKKRK